MSRTKKRKTPGQKTIAHQRLIKNQIRKYGQLLALGQGGRENKKIWQEKLDSLKR